MTNIIKSLMEVNFSTITKYPLIPSTINISRTVKMRLTRATPYF